jgi:hypothetical protein
VEIALAPKQMATAGSRLQEYLASQVKQLELKEQGTLTSPPEISSCSLEMGKKTVASLLNKYVGVKFVIALRAERIARVPYSGTILLSLRHIFYKWVGN